jgi:pilus assembly protein CpaF
VQQSRLRDGSRKIVSISEVVGMEGDTITLQDLFVYRPTDFGPDGTSGGFVSTGIRPGFLEKMADNGIAVRDEWFHI